MVIVINNIIFVHNKFDNVCLIPTLPTTERHVIQSARTSMFQTKPWDFNLLKYTGEVVFDTM